MDVKQDETRQKLRELRLKDPVVYHYLKQYDLHKIKYVHMLEMLAVHLSTSRLETEQAVVKLKETTIHGPTILVPEDAKLIDNRRGKLKRFIIWTIMLILFIVGIWYASTPDLAPCYYDVHGNCN
jgi:hypothetical protein